MKKIDIENWNRKQQYFFFKDFDDPYFNICTEIDVTRLKTYVRDEDKPFFLSLLFYLHDSANEVMEFRLRLVEDEVFEVEKAGIGTTVLLDDDTFAFCYFDRQESLADFIEHGKKRMEQVRKNTIMDEAEGRLDIFHSTSLPWTSFTSIKHARNKAGETAGIPKFVIGKYFRKNDRWMMPISVEVHHALMDGIHLARFLNKLQEKLDKLE